VTLQTFNLLLSNIIVIGGQLYPPLQIQSIEILPAIISIPIALYCWATIMISSTILCIHNPNQVGHHDDADHKSDNSSTTSSELSMPTSRQPRKSQKTDGLLEKCAELEGAHAKLQEKCDELEVRNEELAEEIAMLDGNIDHV
jgi:hypothetical protein